MKNRLNPQIKRKPKRNSQQIQNKPTVQPTFEKSKVLNPIQNNLLQMRKVVIRVQKATRKFEPSSGAEIIDFN